MTVKQVMRSDRMIELQGLETVDYAALRAAIEQLPSAIDLSLLIDLSQARFTPPPVETLQLGQFLHTVKRSFPRIASVMPTNVGYGIGRMIEAHSNVDGGLLFRVFRTRLEALAWLS